MTFDLEELTAAAIDMTQIEGAEATLVEFPELAAHRPWLLQLQALEELRDATEAGVRQIEERIEEVAAQFRQAVEAGQ
jgi:hypothetical protein